MNEPIVAILLTYARTDYALRTIQAARANLRYDNLFWYVADDGSVPEHHTAVLAALEGERIVGQHNERIGYGAGANRAWHVAHDYADLTFWLEDDWELRRELPLAPYADLLTNDSAIGMVRMGYLNNNMQGRVFGYNGYLYWRLDKHADPYVFTGHPSLRHRRFRETYGAYPEGLQPGDTELAMAYQFRTRGGPDIVWPAAFGEWGYFGHIGTEKSY